MVAPLVAANRLPSYLPLSSTWTSLVTLPFCSEKLMLISLSPVLLWTVPPSGWQGPEHDGMPRIKPGISPPAPP